jgi:protein SCO1/2
MKTRNLFRALALTGILLGALFWAECQFPAQLSAHSLHDAGEATTGVDERLGAKIPLDIPFRDEAGQPVRLSDLVNGPTIILPVYYSCTNVCSFLQGGLASALPAVKRKPGAEYRVISVSFDESETPEMAARSKRMYLTAMNAPFPEDGWRFLTGGPESIRRLLVSANTTWRWMVIAHPGVISPR